MPRRDVARSRRSDSRASRRARSARLALIVGVDTGGTFTDVVYRDGARIGTFKLLSTPDDPARAVIAALAHLFDERPIEHLTYGTTVATNAMLERRGVRTALITTKGFEDVLEIGRQSRPLLYELEPQKPEPLVPSRLRLGLHERTCQDGTVERAPRRPDLSALVERIRRSGAESVAVCLLHAHVQPRNERLVARALGAARVPVTLSHELCPAPGEYERTSTTVANAYVRPLVASHLHELAHRSRAGRLRVMQSNGGAIGIEIAAREPVRTMLSGPAGGVAAAFACARAAGLKRVITFDMGGTSTDVALVDGAISRRPETSIGGVPVMMPAIDIHTVGAGGGSIASVDAGGALKVGPESAGADPGPACYGRGTLPTVTDANVVLGRLRPDAFLGGAMQLDAKRAYAAVRALARAMGAPTPRQAAEGMVRVVEGTMERAIRVITVERGQDPRTCVLVAFGGAAALHACGLADALGVPEVVVPNDPGLLSAWGVLEGPVVRDAACALRKTDPAHDDLVAMARRVSASVRGELAREGVAKERTRVEICVRMRYLGQSIELEVPLRRDFRRAFDREHLRLFHTASETRSVEVMGLRVTGIGDAVAPVRKRTRTPATAKAPKPHAQAEVWLSGRSRPTSVHARDGLRAGMRIDGPAIVTEYSSTVWVPPRWSMRIDAHDNLRLARSTPRGRRRG